jgi:hypothetical protein
MNPSSVIYSRILPWKTHWRARERIVAVREERYAVRARGVYLRRMRWAVWPWVAVGKLDVAARRATIISASY